MSSAVPISPVGPVAAATMVFRENGGIYVAAIVKATFAFAHHAVLPLAAPEPIFTRESHRMNNPTRSIVATSDLVPRMPAADVLVLGHAHAPGGSAAEMRVRLVVGRGESTILDKTVHVVGDRKGGEIKPFRSMPLVYEKAYGGPGCRDNPLGTGVLQGDAPPNLVDPEAPDRVVGLGPISRSWPPRSSLAPAEVRAGLDRPVAEIPPGFDLRYFHAAPPDQRVSHLLGDEWIVLEGMHASMPRVHLQLPGAQARTRIVGGEADGRVFSLRADTLRIDADAERCVMVWRNAFPVRESDLGSFRLLAGLELEGAPIAWPERVSARGPAIGAAPEEDAPPPTQVLPPAMQRSAERAAGGTIVLSDEPALASTFSGTMEIADDEIESVHFDGPVEVQAPAPPADFSRTTVLGGQEGPATNPLPAFWQRSQPAPAPPPPRAQAAQDVARSLPTDVRRSRPRDPKDATLDLSHFVSSGQAVIPFAGDRASGPGVTPPADPSPLSATPIPGSPWDPNRLAGIPLEEASTAEADALDLAGTLASPTRSPVAEPPQMVSPAPPPTVTPPAPMVTPPPMVASPPLPPMVTPPEPQMVTPPEPPAASPPPPMATLPEPAQVASLADPPTAPLPHPAPASLADPPTAPLPDPWGTALREAEPAAPTPARAAPKPVEQGPSVRSALYKRFKK